MSRAPAPNRRPIPDELLTAMSVADWLALAEFEGGTAGKRALTDLRASIGIGVELALAGVGAEALMVLRLADLVLRNTAARGMPLLVPGDDLQVMRDAVQVAQDQRGLCTVGDWQQASARDDDRRRGAHRISRQPARA